MWGGEAGDAIVNSGAIFAMEFLMYCIHSGEYPLLFFAK